MAVTVSVYNQVATLFAQGAINQSGSLPQSETADDFLVKLYTNTPSFTATDVLESSLTGTYTPLTHPNYNSTTGSVLTNVTVTQSGNDCVLDADDLTLAAGVTPVTVRFAILFRAGRTGDNSSAKRPLLHIDFGQSETAAANTDFKIVWSASGIFSFVVA